MAVCLELLVYQKDHELLFSDVAWTFEKGNDNSYACVTSITVRTGADSQTPSIQHQSIYCRRKCMRVYVCVYGLQGNAPLN